jgi:hypothetical protein
MMMVRKVAKFLFWLLKGRCPYCGCRKAKHLCARYYECAYCAAGFELAWKRQ